MPHGFLTYQILGQECYLKDLYVEPEFRKSHLATEMADVVTAIAISHGCTYLIGTVCPQAKASTESLKVLLAYGMTLHSAANNLIIFKKDIT